MRKPWIIHPFLFAILPVIILLNDNIEYIPYRKLYNPLLILLLFVLVCLIITSIFVKNIYVSALIVSPMIFILLSSGSIYYYIYATFPKTRNYIFPAISLLGFVAYLLYCIMLVKWGSSINVRRLTIAFNIIALLLILFNASQMIYYYAISKNTKIVANPQDILINYRFAGKPLDIYYIILDEYAGLEQIKSYYNYDNTNFADRLIKKGFFIARKSKVRVANTGLSLAASLNMEYPQEKYKGSEFSSISMSLSKHVKMTQDPYIKELLQNNKVARLLTSHNYRYYHLGSWYYATQYNKYADYNINYFGFDINNPLIIDLYNVSIVRFIFAKNVASINQYFQRESVLGTFAKLSKVAEADGPKFVFAHIICPHEPFIFGPEGEDVPFSKRRDWNDKSLYLGQYIFITGKAEEAIDIIIKKSKTPPIIILQSDHGVRYDKPSSKKIFNAYLLPNNGNTLLYDTISPVNTFRLIFNYYFGARYALMEDSESIIGEK